jgi:phage terminase large subunit-like protein
LKYFDRYLKQIESGKIPACHELKLAIDRIKRYRTQYIFRQYEADKRIKFIENECSNTKGIRTKLKLALPQKVWLETVWGFYNNVKVTKVNPDTMEEYATTEERRLIHEVPIIVSRGSGKTTLASAIAMVGQILDGEYGADIQCLASTREQAGFLFNASRAMTSNEESLLYILKKADMLSSTKQGLLYRETNSLISIKTSDYEVLDGTNAHYNIFDEVHAYDEDFIKVVNDGSNRKRKNWITWYISTNGTKRDKVFDRYYRFWIDVLEGRIENDTVMPFIYKLDDTSEVHKPEMWQKSMPLLGITTEKETIALDIEMSKNDPAMQAELLSKSFNLPVNNYLAFFTNEECQGSREEFNDALFTGNEERNSRCVIGIDLSDVGDICSISFMIVDGEKRYFLNKKYMPRHTIEKLPADQARQYLEWEAEGFLHIHELDYNDQEYIFNDLYEFMNDHKILPIKVGFDKWNSREIIRFFEGYYGDIAFEIPQTVKVLSSPLKVFKEKAKGGKLIFFDPVATWCLSNVNVKIDHNNNIFPSKEKAKNKIDVFASMLDAFICYEINKDKLIYYFE